MRFDLVAQSVLLVSLVAFGGCSEPVAAPTKFQNWTPKESVFHVQYPDGWKAEGGGKQGVQWAEFTKGNCKIDMKTDVTSSLIGDIAGSAGTAFSDGEAPSPELEEELAPVAVVHDMKLKELPGDYKSYKEEKAEKFTSMLGEGRKSPFKATVGVGRKIRGYRATVLAQDRGVTIFCYCPEKDWSKIQPAFDTVLSSLSQGY